MICRVFKLFHIFKQDNSLSSTSVSPFVQRTTVVGVFVFFAGIFVVHSGYSWFAAILLFASLWMLAHRPAHTLERADRILLWTLLMYAVVISAMTLWLGNAHAVIAKALRVLLAAPILLLLLKVPVRQAVLWAGVSVGAVLSALVAWWEVEVLHLGRAAGLWSISNSIHFSNLTLVFAAFCAAGLIWAQTQGRHAVMWRVILVVGMLCGLYSSVMGGSRGSWVALLAVLFVFAVALFKRSHLRRHLVYAALAAVVGVVALTALVSKPNNIVYQRYVAGVSDIAQYRQQNAATSIGARLDMWRAALINLQRHPVIGWNWDDYEEALRQLVQEGRVNQIVLHFEDNLHNNYLYVWAFSGLPGLLALLMVYGVPLWYFGRSLRDTNLRVRAIAICGTILAASYLCVSLTQQIFRYNDGITFFVITLVVLWSMLRHARGANETASN